LAGPPELLHLRAASPVSGSLRAPSSKSVTNRLFVIGALADGTSRFDEPLLSDDTEAMAAGLRVLGVETTLTESFAEVTGKGGVIGPPSQVVGAGLSGTTLRFLVGVSLLSNSPVALDGLPPLRRRPLEPLLRAVEATGARVTSAGGRPPLSVFPCAGGFRGGKLTVDAAESSQFATALLLVAPYARSTVELIVEHLGAGGYLELTVDAMRRFGAEVSLGDHSPGSGRVRVVIESGRHYRARDERVEYDASAAGHLFALALATGGEITVENAVPTSQPDARLVDVLSEMGAKAELHRGGGVTVRLGPAGLSPIDINLSDMPDQVATVAVLAALAPGTSRLRGLEVVRGHETDRLAAVADGLFSLGGKVDLLADGLVVHGGRKLSAGVVDTRGDHRMAMAFSALAGAVDGLVIASPRCVRKTYPRWWDDLAALGVEETASDGPYSAEA
jgi:3-phosphoshikimate 1-carboxyvinyltransferase